MSSTNSLLDINNIYLNQVAEGGLKNLEKASVLAMSDKPEDQDKAREIKTRFDYQSMMKQKKAKKAMKEDKSNWRHDLREIITAQKDTEEPEIKEKKVKNKVTINPKLGEAVEQLGGKLLSVQEMMDDEKEDEKEKAQTKAIDAKQKRANQVKKQVLFRKLQALRSGAEDITAGYEPEGGQIDEIQMPKNTKYARMSYKKLKKTHKDFKNMESKPPRVTVLDKDTQATVSRPVKFVPEAKYESGASNYGKMSIRNKRAVGYGGNAAPPEERQKAHAVRMKKHMTNKGKSAIDPKKNPMSESESLKKAKINFNTSKKGGKTIYKVNKNDEADAQKAMKNDPKYISGKTRVQAHQEAYGGKGVSRKAKLASLHPPTAQAAVKNIPTETDRGAGNKAMRRAGKTVEKKSPTYKAYVANKMDEATRYSKETGKSFKTGRPVVKGGTAKDDKAFQYVAKKYAGQMMGGQQKKKVKGQKPDDSNTPFKRAAARIKQVKADNKALADKAKKAGYKSTQDYVNVQAVRKGGLGT